MNTQSSRNSVQPTVRNLRKHFLPLLLAVVGVLTGGSVGKAATAANIDFSTGYTSANLVGQNGWGAIGTAANNPILVSSSGVALAGGATTPQNAFKTFPYQLTANGGRVFIRFDINVTSASTAATSGFSQGGADIFSVSREIDATGQPTGKTYYRIYIKKGTTGFLVGWNPHQATASATQNLPVYGSAEYAFGQTHTILIRVDSITGLANDKGYLYVNPEYASDPASLTPLLYSNYWTGNNSDELSLNTSSATGRTPGQLNIMLKQGTANVLTVSKIMVGDVMTDVGYVAPATGAVNYTNTATTGTSSWTTSANWTPSVPSSATNSALIFNGALTSTLTVNNDTTGNFSLNSLTFANTGSGTINLTGNPLKFSSMGTTNPTITFANSANLTQQVSNALQFDANVTLANSTNATLDGAISGTGALSKSGAGALRFNASNSYAGGTTISAGTLMLANDNALGSGALNIGTSTTLSITNGSKNIPNPVAFLANYTSSLGGLQKVDWTNQLSGNISGPGVVRINTVYLTAYLSNPTNTFDSVLIGNGAIAANSFGVAGSPSPLGTNGIINFANTGVSVLKYLGSGETNAKTLAFADGATFSILENRGTGPIKFTSPLQILRTAANTLILEPFAPGSGELAASITNLASVDVAVNGTRLAKSGTGDWILSASNDYRNTSVQDGRLIAQNPNALPANRDVEMAGGTLLVNYSGTGATLGNLCLTNYKSSVNRYIDWAVDPETYKFNDSTINLGTNRAATLVFSSATNWIVNQLTDPVTTTTYGRKQYLKVANSAVGAGLYITSTNGVDLSRILCAEDTNLTAKITYSKRLIFVGTQITPTITVLPTAAAITYGQTLANSALTGGSVSVPGTFEFTSPATAPIAGTATYQVIFIPSDETLYNTVTTTVSVTVNKANRTVTFPTAAAITYGQALGSATLTGGSTEGAFAFSAPASVPSAGVAQNFQVVFTPTDEVNYNYDKLTQQVAVTVNKADSTITVNPTGAAITVGQALSSSVLSGGSATDNNGVSLPGTFTWTEASSTPAEGSGSYLVTFTPDSANYKTASGTASVTVNPAPIGPTFATAFGGASATALGSDGMANLLRYALGANSPSGSVVKPVSALDANSLSITAIVRINDPKVTVVGESATDLTAWNTTPIVGVSTADQTGAISGETQKQSFSVPRGPTKTFLRLKATQAN